MGNHYWLAIRSESKQSWIESGFFLAVLCFNMASLSFLLLPLVFSLVLAIRFLQRLAKQMETIYLLMIRTNTGLCGSEHTQQYGWLGDLYSSSTWVISTFGPWWLLSKFLWQESCSVYSGKLMKTVISLDSGY